MLSVVWGAGRLTARAQAARSQVEEAIFPLQEIAPQRKTKIWTVTARRGKKQKIGTSDLYRQSEPQVMSYTL